MANQNQNKGPNKYGQKVITGECRLSFCHLGEPDTHGQYADNKYKADLLFGENGDPALKPLVEECKRLAKEYFGTTEGVKFPWKDGAKYEAKGYAGYHSGSFYLTAKTTQKPRLKDVNRNDIDASVFYGGCVVRANLSPACYKQTKTQIIVENGQQREEEVEIKGVTVYLNAVQFIKDAERFGGGGDDFDDSYANDQSSAESDDGF